MGLSNEGSANRTYLKISDGKIAKRCTADTHGAVECTKKNGEKYHELRFTSVSGVITDVKKRVHDFGTDLCITLEDKGEVFELQMPWSSRYSSGFFTCMPNIDVTKAVKFTPYMKVEGDKKKTALYLTQDNKNVEWYWTKEDPKGLPQMTQVTVKGQKVWDDTERQEFFEKYLVNEFIPKLSGATVTASQEAETPGADDVDSLPF